MYINNNILAFYNKVFKLITSIFIVLFTNNTHCYSNNYDNNFNEILTKYVKIAKKISNKKQITNSDVNLLFKRAIAVLNHIKSNNLQNKFKDIKEVVFRQSKSITYNNEFEENVIKFTMSFFYIFTTLNENHIRNIIIRSPLELVPLLKEMNVFTKFITANANNYGCNKFSTYNMQKCEINVNKDSIMKIMGALINIYLIESNTNKIYKLSNIASMFYHASYLYNQKQNKNVQNSNKIIYKHVINKLQKNINNNERVPIFMDEKISNNNANNMFNITNNILNRNIKEYENSIKKNKSNNKSISINQQTRGDIRNIAKDLFYILKYNEKERNALLKEITNSINLFCKYIAKIDIKNNQKQLQKEFKIYIRNIQVINKFLQTGIKLLNEFVNYNNATDYLIYYCPDMIPNLAMEFNIIINIGNVLQKNNINDKSIKEVINIINKFVDLSDENTYLLSTVFTLAMYNGMSLQQILKSKDISNKKICKYLEWNIS